MDVRTLTTRPVRRSGLLLGLALATALLFGTLFAGSAQASLADFALEASGTSLSSGLAGAHADWTTEFQINGEPTNDSIGQKQPYAALRDVITQLPPGLLANPKAFPKCSAGVFINQIEAVTYCPKDSQIGTVSPGLFGFTKVGQYYSPLFNLEAPGGKSRVVARLGFYGFFYPIFIDIKLDPKREDALTATLVNIPTIANTTGTLATLWAVPTDESHDAQRLTWAEALFCSNMGSCESHASGLPPTPFMVNPTSCGPAGVGTGAVSYQQPEGMDFAFNALPDITDCSAVPFEPTMSLAPTTRSAAAASGLDVSLQIPQPGLTDPEGRASSHLKEAVVTLPRGVALNASAADGLGSCTEQQIGVDRIERQIVGIHAYGAPVSLSFGGQTTAELPEFATAGEAQAALEGLPNVGSGNVAVSGRPGGPWTVDFVGSMAAHDEPAIGGVNSELVRLSIKASGGTYTLGYEGSESPDLPFDAGAAEVQQALEALPGIGAGNVRVTGGRVENGENLRVIFTGSLRGSNASPITTTEDELVPIEGGGASIYPLVWAKTEVLSEGGSSVNTHTVKQGGTLGFDDADPRCPDSSKIATGEISSPVLNEHMSASFYLAKQSENPFNSLFGGYLVAEGAGVMIKVPARIDVDPNTGQVVTTFTDNPQQPFDDLELHFKDGNRGLITTPDECGTYASTYELVPWSGNPPVKGTSEFTLDQNCGKKPFSPGFHAGSENALAGSFTTFATQVTNEAGAPSLKSISVDLPEGVSASLAGVGICSDAALASLPTAPGTGAGQIANPACPASSQIGTVAAGAGSGSPFYVRTGKVYLAGPYKGAPLSLAILTPAVAGPFDLGNVLVRVPVTLDPRTARAHAASDEIPTALSGIPLDLRDVRVLLDRQGFALNPTSCEPKQANGVIGGEGGASAAVSDRFQVGECAALGFKPKLALKLKGGTKRGDHPALTTVFRPRAGDANTQSVQVALPKSEFLDQSHIGTVCTRVQFAADQCPKASVYGTVTAQTPLLDSPLTGNVYLRSSEHELPDLVMDLRGPASQPIHLEAAARIDTVKGGIRATFEFVPDAPIARVVLKMKGARKGLLQNSRDICAKPYKAAAVLTAHNGRSFEASPPLQARCPKARKGKGHGKSRG